MVRRPKMATPVATSVPRISMMRRSAARLGPRAAQIPGAGALAVDAHPASQAVADDRGIAAAIQPLLEHEARRALGRVGGEPLTDRLAHELRIAARLEPRLVDVRRPGRHPPVLSQP